MAAEELRGVDLTGAAPAGIPEPVVRVACAGKRGWLARLAPPENIFVRYPDRVFVRNGLPPRGGQREFRVDAAEPGAYEACSWVWRDDAAQEVRVALRVADGRVVAVGPAEAGRTWAGVRTGAWNVGEEVAARAEAAHPLAGTAAQRAFAAELRHAMARLLDVWERESARDAAGRARVAHARRALTVPAEARWWIDRRDVFPAATRELLEMTVVPRRDRLGAVLAALSESETAVPRTGWERRPVYGTGTVLRFDDRWSVWRPDAQAAWEALAARDLIPAEWADGAPRFLGRPDARAWPATAREMAVVAMDPAGLLAATELARARHPGAARVLWAVAHDRDDYLIGYDKAPFEEGRELGFELRVPRRAADYIVVVARLASLRAAAYDAAALEEERP